MKKVMMMLLVAMVCLISGCGELDAITKPEPTFTLGQYDGQNYSNDFFKLALIIPEGWIIDDRSKASEGSKFSRGIVLLAHATEHAPGYQGFNANMNITSNPMSKSEFTKTLNTDFSEKMKAQVEDMGLMLNSFDSEVHQKTIDGFEVQINEYHYVVNDIPLEILQLSHYSNGHCIVATFTYSTESEKAVQSIIDSIRLK